MSVIVGDALELPLRDQSVQCVVTSPPYWGLRQYSGDQVLCWDEPDGTEWTGALGLEPTPEMYVGHLVAIFEEVRRVLREDGVLWVNLGDSYVRDARKGKHKPGDSGKQEYVISRGGGRAASSFHLASEARGSSDGRVGRANRAPVCVGAAGHKEKDLVGIPWTVAFALKASGWYLRSDIIWAKPNPLPESVRDRPTRAHEYLFLLTKSPRYYYDINAIREPFADARQGRDGSRRARERNRGGRTDGFTKPNGIDPAANGGKNIRSVWTITPRPFRDAHFATFPPELVTRCVKAGSRVGDLVLDPFGGAGTTALVATALGRRALSVDLALPYAQMAKRRLA